jgi:hypothetical protein
MEEFGSTGAETYDRAYKEENKEEKRVKNK